MNYSCWTPWLALGAFILLIILVIVVWSYLASINDKFEHADEFISSQVAFDRNVEENLLAIRRSLCHESSSDPHRSSQSYGYVSGSYKHEPYLTQSSNKSELHCNPSVKSSYSQSVPHSKSHAAKSYSDKSHTAKSHTAKSHTAKSHSSKLNSNSGSGSDCGYPSCSCGCKDGYDCTCDHSTTENTSTG